MSPSFEAYAERPNSRDDFEIAIICALPTEASAVEAAFDEIWENAGSRYGKSLTDSNVYTMGLMCNHYVVLAYMQRMGKREAATVATDLKNSFTGIKLALLVGVCGGVPSYQNGDEVFLGDVMIAEEVVEYDFGKQYPGRQFVRPSKDLSPPREVGALLAKLKTAQSKKVLQDNLANNIAVLSRKLQYQAVEYPGSNLDHLFDAKYQHRHHAPTECKACTDDFTCEDAQNMSCQELGCDSTFLVSRQRLPSAGNGAFTVCPKIRFGRFASGDIVMKSGEHRDEIAKQKTVIAFEMEGAGIYDIFPCLVIKGVCDYADSHKNKIWQPYAAITAAACMKAVLFTVDKSERIQSVSISPHFATKGKEKEECAKTLSFSDMDARRQDISAAHRSTCSWILRNTKFKKWQNGHDLQTNNGVLWIKGKPGAGKSTLMKYILKNLEETAFRDHIILKYFFNARGSTLEKTPVGMLRSLVYQLIDQDIDAAERFLVLYRDKLKKHSRGQWEWRKRELEEYLTYEANKPHRKPIIFLIDALDECSTEDVETIVEFLETVSTDAVHADVDIRICLSSRHYPTITITKCLELVVEQIQGHSDDIKLYIQDRLKGRNETIEYQIYTKADGIFMWVVLVVAMLNKAYNRGQIEAMQTLLDELPPDLEQVFQKLLTQDMDDKDETILALQWVLFSRRPLSPDELFFALQFGTTPKRLIPWENAGITSDVIRNRINHSSKGLIETRKVDNTLQFIHLSVKDFLLRNGRLGTLDSNLLNNPVGKSHNHIKECCFAYLEISIQTNGKEQPINKVIDSFPLLQYVRDSIFYHAEKAQASGIPQHSFMQSFLTQPYMSNLLIKLPSVYARTPAYCRNVLQILAQRGYVGLVRDLSCCAGFDVNAHSDGRYGNALQAAVFVQHPEMMTLLLDLGANINANAGPYGYALQIAAIMGDRKIMQILLEHGANVNAKGGYFGNALQAAAANPYSGSEHGTVMLELLLRNGANVNAQGGTYGSALQAAVFENTKKVEFLLGHGADANAKGGKYGSALQIAANHGDEDIVRILLQHGARLNSVGREFDNLWKYRCYIRPSLTRNRTNTAISCNRRHSMITRGLWECCCKPLQILGDVRLIVFRKMSKRKQRASRLREQFPVHILRRDFFPQHKSRSRACSRKC